MRAQERPDRRPSDAVTRARSRTTAPHSEPAGMLRSASKPRPAPEPQGPSLYTNQTPFAARAVVATRTNAANGSDKVAAQAKAKPVSLASAHESRHASRRIRNASRQRRAGLRLLPPRLR